MRTLVLRKSVGQFSAGTRVTPILSSQTRDGVTVEATYTHVDYFKDFNGNMQEKCSQRTTTIEISPDLLTELRERTAIVPAIARINRPERKARRILWEMLNGKA